MADNTFLLPSEIKFSREGGKKEKHVWVRWNPIGESGKVRCRSSFLPVIFTTDYKPSSFSPTINYNYFFLLPKTEKVRVPFWSLRRILVRFPPTSSHTQALGDDK